MATKVTPRLVELVKPALGQQSANFKPQFMEHIAQKLKLLSIPTTLPRNVANVGGDRSYVLLGSLAKLERALMKWTMNELISKHGFRPVVVPNILHDHIIERCGFPTKSHRSQVYKISGTSEGSIFDEDSNLISQGGKTNSCIAGTSEFALASIHIGDTIPHDELPKKYCATSRCYRAESSSTTSEWGLYRVHYFNKTEMFAYTMPDQSSQMHEEFLSIQKSLYNQLNLHYQVLDMPEDDLALSAKKKYDIEAWMGGRGRFGEISSTSNCEDYQSSRLNVTYSQMTEKDNQLVVDKGYVHTVNGTACSSIRTLIAIFEQHQTEDGRVEIPDVLVPYMSGAKYLPTQDDDRLLKEIDLYPETSQNKKSP